MRLERTPTEQPETVPAEAAPAPTVARVPGGLSPLDVLHLQRTAGNRAARAAIENARRPVLLRLGTPLDTPVPATEPQPESELAGQQRRYTPDQYVEMWESEQGRKLNATERDEIDRGCIGLTAVNLNGGGDPPLDLVFGSFDQAHEVMTTRNGVLDWMASAPLIGSAVSKARYIVFAKLFWSNQDPDEAKRKTSAPDKFLPDAKTGRVDMTDYVYNEQPGFVNFDYGWWDDSTGSFWHANHSEEGDPDDPMVVLQSTKEKFAKLLSVAGEKRFGYPDFDRVVFGVALAQNYDPGLAAIASAKP